MKNVLVLEKDTAIQQFLDRFMLEEKCSLRVYKATNCADAYQLAMEHPISLFLLDIVTNPSLRNDVSGLKYIERIRHLDAYAFTPVIFITALEDPRRYAYENIHCYGYLSKPIPVEEAFPLLRGALRYTAKGITSDVVYLRKDSILYAVRKKEIIYIESHGGSAVIHTLGKELMVYYHNCKSLLSELNTEDFLQCSRGTIVNKNYIAHIDTVNRLIQLVENYGTLEIGSRMKKQFLEQLQRPLP